MNFEIEQFTCRNMTTNVSEMVGVVSLTKEEQSDDTIVVNRLTDMGVIDHAIPVGAFEVLRESLNGIGRVIYVYERAESEHSEGNPPVCILRTF